jgi:hypothetical protein
MSRASKLALSLETLLAPAWFLGGDLTLQPPDSRMTASVL